jgi:MarR-like DNA-binding transcriptional regulator SgrR of sgrS sRNA
MQKLQKLKQYQRIAEKFGYDKVTTTIAELTAALLCSERHTYNLVKQWNESGWIQWLSQPGRGKKATLQCLMPLTVIREELLQELLLKGDYQSALQIAEGDPGYLSKIISPFLGGRWFRNLPTLRIPYYRPLSAVTPLLVSGRAERHISDAVYAGLTRFVIGNDEAQPDIAHHWESNADHTLWHFYLRSGLHWHNGQFITQEELLDSFRAAFRRRAASLLLPDIQSATLTAPWRLTLTLNKPDAVLPHRLAHRVFKIAHPLDESLGCGAFSVIEHNPHFLRLERHTFYHDSLPLVHAIEYWCTPDNAVSAKIINSTQINVGAKRVKERVVNSVDIQGKGFTFLVCNANSTRLNAVTIHWLSTLSRRLMDVIFKNTNDVSSSNYTQPVTEEASSSPKLPKILTMSIYATEELKLFSSELKKTLAKLNCELIIYHKNVEDWYSCAPPQADDLYLGDFLFNNAPSLSIEESFRTIPYWRKVLPDYAYDNIGNSGSDDYNKFKTNIVNLVDKLLDAAIITPLFSYRYRVNNLSNVYGIHFTVHGWFDFNRVWIGDENHQPSRL